MMESWKHVDSDSGRLELEMFADRGRTASVMVPEMEGYVDGDIVTV
jgi:hypothetical protein